MADWWPATHLLARILYSLEEVSLLFSSGLQLIGWTPPTIWTAICFTQHPLVISSQNTLTETTTIMVNPLSGHVAQPKWYIKLSITVSVVRISQFSLDIFISFLPISFCIFIDNFYNSPANIFVGKTLGITHIWSYGIVLVRTKSQSISMKCVLLKCLQFWKKIWGPGHSRHQMLGRRLCHDVVLQLHDKRSCCIITMV